MSRHNKVNPDHYKVAGRLSADDLARERHKQGVGKPVRGGAIAKAGSRKGAGASARRGSKAAG